MNPMHWPRQRWFSIVICIVSASIAITIMTIGKPKAIITLPRQPQSPPNELPIADYGSIRAEDTITANARQARGNRYEKRVRAIREYAGNIDEAAMFTHWDSHLTSLPSDKSSFIVIGQIVGARAYLTNDRSNVYSEFSLRLDEIIKDSNALLNNKTGETLSVTREGGAVRFVSGKIQKYRVASQQMPAKGRTYLIFLSGDSIDDVMIITGYELREGKVYPLDASQQFSIYAGTNQVDFLNAVRDSMKGGK